MYNELKKIVNEINGTAKTSTIRTCGYFNNTKVERITEYKEIDLQDLLLAYEKICEEYIENLSIDVKIRFLASVKENFKRTKHHIVDLIDLSKPLSNQKEEVYKSLIEILK